jgi:signal transduction histidine kinase
MAFLVYPAVDLAGRPEPADRVIPAAAATAAVLVIYLRLTWGPQLSASWSWTAIGVMTAAGIAVPAACGAAWLGLLLFPAVAVGLLADSVTAIAVPAGLAGLTAGLGFGIGAAGVAVLSVCLVTLLSGMAAAGLSRFAHVNRELRAAQAEAARLAAIHERARLGWELHDAVKQHLFVAAMELGAARELLDSDPAAAVHVTRAEEAVSEARWELTEIIDRVRADPVGRRDVAEAVRRYARSWSGRHGTTVDIRTASHETCPADVGDAVVLAAQEALANVARHAQASRVQVNAACSDQSVRLEIVDDGVGFDPQQRRGHGLSIMAERLAAVAGEATITSAPGDGTRVVVTWPVQEGIQGTP